MNFALDKRFKKRVQGRFNRFQFEVGVLNDGPYKVPKRGVPGLKGADVITMYAGGPRRQVTNRPSGKSISDVSEANRERLGFNYLSKPFEDQNSEIIKFSKEFFKLAMGKSGANEKRTVNLLQAIVRNPILRGEYGGPNSALTKRIKGFNRPMIDTAQLFKALRARMLKRTLFGDFK